MRDGKKSIRRKNHSFRIRKKQKEKNMMENDSVFHFYGVSICSGQKKLLLLDAIRPHARTSQTMDELEKKSKIKRKKVDAYCFGS